MVFPETERVVYERNTIEEAKCEMHFPPILAIEANPPAAFQEVIREHFPYYDDRPSVRAPQGVPRDIVESVARSLSNVGAKTWTFTSEDGTSSIGLRKNCVFLLSKKYERWELFRTQLSSALIALNETFHPAFFNHTCVRYKNAIRRSDLNLENIDWDKLLETWTIGPLALKRLSNITEGLQSQCLLDLPDNAGKIEALFSTGVHNPSNEKVFILASHVFNDGRKEFTDVVPCIDGLHEQAGRFFRFCIKDELHDAMRPTKV